MGVYIKGMEMPKVAGRLEAVIQIHKDGSAIIAVSPAEDEIGYWKEYPLLPVPDHGRLIDADALYEECTPIGWDGKSRSDYVCAITGNQIKNAPTIIPADKEGET